METDTSYSPSTTSTPLQPQVQTPPTTDSAQAVTRKRKRKKSSGEGQTSSATPASNPQKPSLKDVMDKLSASVPQSVRVLLDPASVEQAASTIFANVLSGRISVNAWARSNPPTKKELYLVRSLALIIMIKGLLWILMRHGSVQVASQFFVQYYLKEFGLGNSRAKAVQQLFRWFSRLSIVERQNAAMHVIGASSSLLRELVEALDAPLPTEAKRDPMTAIPTPDTGIITTSRQFEDMIASQPVVELDEDVVERIVAVYLHYASSLLPEHSNAIPKRLPGSLAKYGDYLPIMHFFHSNRAMFSKKSKTATWVYPKELDRLRPRGPPAPPTVFRAQYTAEPMDVDKTQPYNTASDHISVIMAPALPPEINVDDQNLVQQHSEQQQAEQPLVTAPAFNLSSVPTTNITTSTITPTDQSFCTQGPAPDVTVPGPQQDQAEVYSNHSCPAFAQLLRENVSPPSAECGFPNLPRPKLPPPSNPSRFYRPSLAMLFDHSGR